MKKYKKMIILLIITLGGVALVFLGFGKSPTKVVDINLSKLQKGKDSKLLDKAIKEVIETRYSVIHDETREAIYDLYKDLDYKIIKEQVWKDSNEATVFVEAVLPNVTGNVGFSLMKSGFEMQSNPMKENPTDEEIRERMNTYIRNGFSDIEKYERKIQINLSKKYGRWVLDEDKESLERFIGTVEWSN